MSEYILTQINIYPVKSLGGISLTRSFAGEKGLQHDRRWMLVDNNNCFITQRDNSLMATIGLKFTTDGFELFHKQLPQSVFPLPFSLEQGSRSLVKVWDDHCEAINFENDINDWLSEILKQHCRIIYMPDDVARHVDKKFAFKNETVSFADGYPFLIIGESSLNDLNGKLTMPVSMNRFRPNLVFSGGGAYDEDRWSKFNIGDAIFLTAKSCSRCVITTIDQESGVKSAEPLKTLSLFRKENNNVNFGQNLVVQKQGLISLNDPISF